LNEFFHKHVCYVFTNLLTLENELAIAFWLK